MPISPALALAEKHLWTSKAREVAVHPEIYCEALNTTTAFLGAGRDPHSSEQVVACSVETPTATLGTSNTWLLTTHRLRIMELAGLVDVAFEKLEKVEYRRGFLGASLILVVAGEEHDLTLDEPLRFLRFFEALLELPPEERNPTVTESLPFEEPRIALLKRLVASQAAAGSLDEEELADRSARIELLEQILFHGRPMANSRWLSPLAQDDLVAVLPRLFSEPEQARSTDGVTVYTMGKSLGSLVAGRLLDRATLGAASAVKAGASLAKDIGALWKPDSWKPPSLHPKDLNQVEVHVDDGEHGSRFRYRISTVLANLDLYEAEPQAAAYLLDDLAYEEARVLLLRWALDAEAPVAELMKRSPEEVSTALAALGVEGDVTHFYRDLLESWAWAARLDDHLPEAAAEELRARRGESAVEPEPPPPPAVHSQTNGSGYGRLAGFIQMANAVFTAAIVVPTAWFVVIAILVQIDDGFLPTLSFAVFLVWPLTLVEIICGLLAVVAPTNMGKALYVGMIAELLSTPLGACHGVLVAGVVGSMRWFQLALQQAALDDEEEPDALPEG